MKEKNKVGLLLPYFKTYYKPIASDDSACWCIRHRGQWSRIGFRNRSTHTGQLIFSRDDNVIQRERIFISTNGAGAIG